MTKFYEKNYQERLVEIVSDPSLAKSFQEQAVFEHEKLIENYLTDFSLPVGVLYRLQVDGKKYVVPMATEEASVVAAANNGSKYLGNIQTVYQTHSRFGQILVVGDFDQINTIYQANQKRFKEIADSAYPSIVKRNGGLQQIHFRQLDGNHFSFDVLIDTKDAMGANIVNTILESLADFLRARNVSVIAAIISNLPTTSMTELKATVSGIDQATAKKIADLSHFGLIDLHRAATDNKGFLNGASSVVLATGNDWRAFEAGAHAYAAVDGNYKSFTSWKINSKNQLTASVKLPVSLGIVGGTINGLKSAQAALRLLDVKTSDELAKVVLATGLAQNFAALKALVSEGIQKGHMKMQHRAEGDAHAENR
ncbi:hydroxymethylglutaryl-CoA reductase, degradative [Oenococcus oeni]|uniref:hydroxymethylglutaryl-CoA reductase, degradative n=1 Tax=Oenococcus oeni TaxID=1247 RepID=UPI0008F84C07|nr:hydroxymethylglutaryl-CoA reductase, degradative [Oenococcus oeni]MDV7687655.1 hydroxymethylglutaryl-CoA reductase, degradative [Oenococcus oeni]OIM24247.1 hydroxymethylglutaryl-CoA reductase, degradative [Oenococcus oeni]SYW17895.1 3-hydroxy-3-methylglutaryl coenzyme A reductase [Oenococcus oeni]